MYYLLTRHTLMKEQSIYLMIKFGTNAMSALSALKVQVRIRALRKTTLAVYPVCFSRLELLAWGFIPMLKNLIIE
jgi:hypothetical protein